MGINLENKIQQTLSQSDYDIDAQELKMQQQKLEMERFKQNTQDRKWLALWSAWVVSLWLFAVILILLLNGVLNLSDAVLITLLTTTTFNILGLTFIVLKGHFNSLKRRF